MYLMFFKSKFNGDISKWNVYNLQNMTGMFYDAEFNGDISNWKPYSLESKNNIFENCKATIPYWANIEDKDKRNLAIDNYWLAKELSQDLDGNKSIQKKMKL
jgi:hypothetical protein